MRRSKSDLDQILLVLKNQTKRDLFLYHHSGKYRLCEPDGDGVKEISPLLSATALYDWMEAFSAGCVVFPNLSPAIRLQELGIQYLEGRINLLEKTLKTILQSITWVDDESEGRVPHIIISEQTFEQAQSLVDHRAPQSD